MADQIMVSAASGKTFVLAKATGVEGLRIVKFFSLSLSRVV